VSKCLTKWGIDRKIFSSNDRMQQILGEQLSFQNILNPIAQEGLKVAELDLSMNRESIKYVKGSEAGKEHLNNALSKLEALTLRWA